MNWCPLFGAWRFLCISERDFWVCWYTSCYPDGVDRGRCCCGKQCLAPCYRTVPYSSFLYSGSFWESNPVPHTRKAFSLFLHRNWNGPHFFSISTTVYSLARTLYNLNIFLLLSFFVYVHLSKTFCTVWVGVFILGLYDWSMSVFNWALKRGSHELCLIDLLIEWWVDWIHYLFLFSPFFLMQNLILLNGLMK